MEISFWASTDIGKVREINEDNFLVDKRLRLFVVCDGMGGHAAGEVASAMSVRSVREVVSARRDLIELLNEQPDDLQACQEMTRLLEHAVQEANRRIFEASREDESRRGMGTTCTLLLLTRRRGFIAHVGDSRVYLMRQRKMHQLTDDHSLYNEMVRLGKIRAGDPINLPNKNAVTRAVGVREGVEVDTMDFDVLEQDRFLVCSDGLCGYFKSDEQILAMLGSSEDVREVTELCIAFAVESGGKDNITALVVHVDLLEDPRALEREQILNTMRQAPFFQYLSEKELLLAASMARIVAFEAGQSPLTQDEALEPDLYLVARGELLRRPEIGPATMLGEGELVGEAGFIDGQPHDFALEGVTEGELVLVERQLFLELLRKEPTLAVKLLWNFLQVFSFALRQAPTWREPSPQELDEVTPARLTVGESYAQEADLDVTPPTRGIVVEEDAGGHVRMAHEPTQRVVLTTPGVTLTEETESREDEEDASSPREDLRATVQFDWGPEQELAPSRAPAAPRPPSAPPALGASAPPPLPVKAALAPPVPRPTTPPPLSRGISGEAVVSGSAPPPPPRGAAAEVAELTPPKAAVMRRTVRKPRRDGMEEESGVEEVLAGRGHSSDLLTTVQLDLTDLELDDDEPLRAPRGSAARDFEERPETRPLGSSKVQVNFGDDQT